MEGDKCEHVQVERVKVELTGRFVELTVEGAKTLEVSVSNAGTPVERINIVSGDDEIHWYAKGKIVLHADVDRIPHD